jgi:hypothetical protein
MSGILNGWTGRTRRKRPLGWSGRLGAFSEGESVQAIYVDAAYIYYMTSRTEQYVDRVGSYNSTFTQVSIVQLNTETFEKQVVFGKITDSGRSLLGIDYTVGDTWMFLQYCYGFFLNDSSLFSSQMTGSRKWTEQSSAPKCWTFPLMGILLLTGGRSITSTRILC